MHLIVRVMNDRLSFSYFVLEGFRIDYITIVKKCYRNKTIIEYRLLLRFEYDITTVEDRLLPSELSI